jgi:glutaminase
VTRPWEAQFVSTGNLPEPETVQRLVDEAHRLSKDDGEGRTAQVYPALARADPDRFGICVAGVGGNVYAAGDVDERFTIMSVSKPFVFALVCEQLGAHEARERIGANATGLPFDSLDAVERGAGVTNPMVNAGAIAVTSLVEGGWPSIHEGLSRFVGRTLDLDEEVLASALATNARNRELAAALERHERLGCPAGEAVDLYTRQCALRVSAVDLAVMGATLADGGVNPMTGERVIAADVCHHVLAVMITAGLYETSGDWLYDVGLPGKSGIGGGIVTVSPGKGGLGTFSPRLDAAGNSVRGEKAARFLSSRLGLDLLVSEPVRR